MPSAGAKEYVNGVLPKGTLLGPGPNVTAPEPRPKRHRLWKAPDAYITPYILGGSHLAKMLVVRISAADLRAYLSRLLLKNVIDFKSGYRPL